RASKGLCVARLAQTHLRTAMRAGIEKCADLPVLSAHQDDAPGPDVARAEVSRARNLGFMTGVKPAMIEHSLVLPLENRRVGEALAVDAKQASLAIVDQQAIRHRIAPNDDNRTTTASACRRRRDSLGAEELLQSRFATREFVLSRVRGIVEKRRHLRGAH